MSAQRDKLVELLAGLTDEELEAPPQPEPVPTHEEFLLTLMGRRKEEQPVWSEASGLAPAPQPEPAAEPEQAED